MDSLGAVEVVIVGAGPRGTSVMERLLARYAAAGAAAATSAPLHIHLVDPYPPGAGHVWRTEQSRLYLMNTPSFFPTLVPDQGVDAPPLAGCSFEDWRQLQLRDPDASLSGGDRTELAALETGGFPSRPLYGRYLSWCVARLLERMPDGATVTIHPAEAKRVARDHANGGYGVELVGGGSLHADAVVLALGHVDARLGAAQRGLRDRARALGLTYVPPAVPADVDWGVLPAGEPVLVRGMGLNFFDVLGQLTEGRGGRFEPTGGPDGAALAYVPSGREPVIVGGSRRGTPYRAKARQQGCGTEPRLRFLGEDAAARIRAMGATAGFDHDIWPLLHRDTLWAYYSTLARTSPGAVADGFLEALDALLHEGLDGGGPGGSGPAGSRHGDSRHDGGIRRGGAEELGGADWAQRLKELVADQVSEGRALDLPSLARPLSRHPLKPGGRHRFASRQALDAAVLAQLVEDAAACARGTDDPVKMAVGALNAGRAVIKLLVADNGITAESWLGELRGWFEGFVEGLASGPPALRMEQLAALVRAGVVHFTGPDPVFDIDDGLFQAHSPWVDAEPWRARHLVEAQAPANQVQGSASRLLNNLQADGLARPKVMLASDGGAVVTSGLDVSAPPYRPLDGAGKPMPGLYVLGLQLSSVQWGTAIAAQARAGYRSGYRTILDADAIAADILARGVPAAGVLAADGPASNGP